MSKLSATPKAASPITRRDFLRRATVASAAGLALTAGLGATGCSTLGLGKRSTVAIKLAHPLASDYSIAVGYRKFRDLVNERSNGELQLSVFENASLGSAKAVLESCKTGSIQMASAVLQNFAPYTKAYAAFDLPYLVDSNAGVYKIIDSPVGKDIAGSAEQIGFKALMLVPYAGLRQIFNTKRRLKTPADMVGLKVGIPNSPVDVDTIKAMGGIPNPRDYGQAYTLMLQGITDAESVDFEGTYTSKLQEQMKFGSVLNWALFIHMLVANLDFWNKLPKDQQDLIEKAAAEATTWQRTLAGQMNDQYLAKLKEAQVEIYTPTDAEMKQWKASVKPVWDKYVPTIGADKVDQIQKAAG